MSEQESPASSPQKIELPQDTLLLPTTSESREREHSVTPSMSSSSFLGQKRLLQKKTSMFDFSKTKKLKTVFTNEEIKHNLETQIKSRENQVKLTKGHDKIIKISKTQGIFKRAFILYSSGCAGANLNTEIVRGLLRNRIASNHYLSDYKLRENLEDKSFLVTPELENRVRVLYRVQQFNVIEHSVNVTLSSIKHIARLIYENYKSYDAFIVLAGEDAICTIGTYLSFMFEHLSKLIIVTGGFFPITYMRNDIISSLISSFSIVGAAENFNDVIIVTSSKGYRANRSIVIHEGEFGSVQSPNIDPLVSINIKIKFRQNLFLPPPSQQCRLWTNLSERVGIIRFNILLSIQALEYELNNPAYDAFVIEGYASNNLPDKLQILNLFKRIAEEKGTIFVSITESVTKMVNTSKRQYLEQFHIYVGGDITLNAAMAKLAYLLSKDLSRQEMKKLIYSSIRGEISEDKKDNQFEVQNLSFMEIIDNSVQRFYPTKKYPQFIAEVQDTVAKFSVHESCSKQIQQLFKKVHIEEHLQAEVYQQQMANLINRNYLLHKAVQNNNQELYQYFLEFAIDINALDENECSAMHYAVAKRNKKTILYLSKKGGEVICPSDQLFELIIQALQKDDHSYFELLYHIEFKETLKEETNIQGRTALHLAALLGAEKCLSYMLQKFKFNLKVKDVYGKTYSDYTKNVFI